MVAVRSKRTQLHHVRRAGVAVLCALSLLGLPARGADDPGAAKELAAQGLREFNLGHWAEALALLERAYRAKPLPEILYNTAQCQRLLGNLEQARRVYRAFLASQPREELAAAARQNLAEVEQALRKQESVAQGAPQTLAAPEKPPAIVPGQLEAALMQSQTPPAPSPPAPPAARRAPPQAIVAAPVPARSSGMRLAAISCGAAAVVAAGVGTYFGFAAKSATADWSSATTNASWSAARDDAQGKARAATISWIAAGALGAAAVALFLLAR